MIYKRDFIDGEKNLTHSLNSTLLFGWMNAGCFAHKKQLLRKGNRGIVRILICLFVPLCAMHSSSLFLLLVLPTNEWMSIGSESAPKRVKWSKKSQLISIAIKI